jgi:hypothetical protein
MYRKFFGAATLGEGWFSFDIQGVHFISLVNTTNLDALGRLGPDQLGFVRRDVAGLSSETPIVLFSHIPLYAMYPKWGWRPATRSRCSACSAGSARARVIGARLAPARIVVGGPQLAASPGW